MIRFCLEITKAISNYAPLLYLEVLVDYRMFGSFPDVRPPKAYILLSNKDHIKD